MTERRTVVHKVDSSGSCYDPSDLDNFINTENLWVEKRPGWPWSVIGNDRAGLGPTLGTAVNEWAKASKEQGT